jgi:hypothetical protein
MASQAYVFAHRAVPHEAFRDPARFLGILNGPDGERYLHDLWQHAGNYADAETLRADEEPRHEITFTSNGVIALIWPPPPAEVPEAHIVGVFARLADPYATTLRELSWIRVFTLEQGHDHARDEPVNMLCEWTEDGTHRSHGRGPDSTEERPFIDAVHTIVRREPPRA